MRKRICIITNGCLLLWFTFCLTGLSFGKYVFVESAWGEIDRTMYFIYLALFIFFLVKDKYGKYLLTIFCLLWLITQLMFHEYFTLFGASTEKLTQYQSNFFHTVQMFPHPESIIVPDLYHIILHLLIFIVLTSMVLYCISSSKRKNNKISHRL